MAGVACVLVHPLSKGRHGRTRAACLKHRFHMRRAGRAMSYLQLYHIITSVD